MIDYDQVMERNINSSFQTRNLNENQIFNTTTPYQFPSAQRNYDKINNVSPGGLPRDFVQNKTISIGLPKS